MDLYKEYPYVVVLPRSPWQYEATSWVRKHIESENHTYLPGPGPHAYMNVHHGFKIQEDAIAFALLFK